MKKTQSLCKNKELSKAVFRLCSSFAMIVAVLIMYAGISFGWFASNTEVEAKGISIDVQTPEDMQVEVSFFYATALADGKVTFNLDTPQDATLPTYQLLDDTTHYALMKITATVGEATVPVNLNISTETTEINSVLDATGNKLSHILRFATVTPEDGTVSLPTAYQSFAVLKGTQASLQTTPIEYTCTDSEALYILISYNVDIINWLYSKNIGNDAIEELSQLSFANDMAFNITTGGTDE